MNNNIDWHSRAKDSRFCVQNVVDGSAVVCVGKEINNKLSSRDGSLLYTFCDSSSDEVDQAVASAKQSFDDGRWRRLTVQQRKNSIQKLADLVDSHQETLALYECLDVGKPISQALGEVSRSADILRCAAEGADKLLSCAAADDGTLTVQWRKPVGVVAAIIGWNFPLILAAQKIGPALVMCNSMVLKPSEFTSLSAGYLASLALEAGIPAGVLNVVHGAGHTVGMALANHQAINLLSFTGSSETGKKMLLAAGQSNMKRLMLECGGKSPYIVFNDCPDDLDLIATDIVQTAFRNQGQVCTAGSRLLIQDGIKEKLLPKILAQATKLQPQDPLNPDTTFGALINEAHLQKVLGYIDKGKQEGAKLLIGGERFQLNKRSVNGQGCYLAPTIFDQVDPQQTIATEEIFGPVLSVTSFKGEQEAIKIANNTRYGLAAYVATQNMSRAQRLSRCLDAGFITILGTSSPSSGGIDIGLEGHRQSGFGHEGGLEGLASYTVSTSTYFIG